MILYTKQGVSNAPLLDPVSNNDIVLGLMLTRLCRTARDAWKQRAAPVQLSDRMHGCHSSCLTRSTNYSSLSDREVMRGVRAQTTLNGPCTVTGRGYWSGEVNTLTFLPAPAGTGIRFVRTDLPGRPSVQATAEYRISMPLRTRLSDGRCEVDMVEHVMAALSGLRIDNAEVHCTAAEMPGMDGSSLAFVLALDGIGKVSLRAKRDALVIREPFTIHGERGIVSVEPSKSGEFEVEYQLDYGPSSPIGQATFSSRVTEDDFYHSIAPARTFISQEEAAALQRKGIAKHVTNRDLIVFSSKGPVDNSLRFDDECARHKALDLIGDLALSGVDLVGRIIARQSGHQLNGQVAERLRDTFYDQRGWARAA